MTATKAKVNNFYVKGDCEQKDYLEVLQGKTLIDLNKLKKKVKRIGCNAKLSDDSLNAIVNYAFENADNLNDPNLETIDFIFRRLDQKHKQRFINLYSELISDDISYEVNYVLDYIYNRYENLDEYFTKYCLSEYLEYQIDGSCKSFNVFIADCLSSEVRNLIDIMLEDNNYSLADDLSDEAIEYFSWLRKYLNYEFGQAYLTEYINRVCIELEEDYIVFGDFVQLAIEHGKENLY